MYFVEKQKRILSNSNIKGMIFFKFHAGPEMLYQPTVPTLSRSGASDAETNVFLFESQTTPSYSSQTYPLGQQSNLNPPPYPYPSHVPQPESAVRSSTYISPQFDAGPMPPPYSQVSPQMPSLTETVKLAPPPLLHAAAIISSSSSTNSCTAPPLERVHSNIGPVSDNVPTNSASGGLEY